jgi:hypothetical protein
VLNRKAAEAKKKDRRPTGYSKDSPTAESIIAHRWYPVQYRRFFRSVPRQA